MFSTVEMLIGVVTLSVLLCLSESARIASTKTTLMPTTEAISGAQLDRISRLQRQQFREELSGQLASRGLAVAGARLQEEVDRSRGDSSAAVEVEEQVEMSGNGTAEVSQSRLDSAPADVKSDRVRIPNSTHRQRPPRPADPLQQPQQRHPLTTDQLPAKTTVRLYESFNRQRPATVERHQPRQLFALTAAHSKTQQQQQRQENQQIIAQSIAKSTDGEQKFSAGTTAVSVTKPTTTLLPQQAYRHSQAITNASWNKEPTNPHDYIPEDIAEETEAAYVIGDVELLQKTSTKTTTKPDLPEYDIMDHTPYFLPSVADLQRVDGKLGDVFQFAVDQVQARTPDDDYFNDTTLGYDEVANTTVFLNTTTTTTFIEVTNDSSVNDSSRTIRPDDVTDETTTIINDNDDNNNNNNNNNYNNTLLNDSGNTTTSDVTADYNIEAERTLNVSTALPPPSIAKWIPPPIVQFAAGLERRDGASTTRTQQQQQQNWNQHRTDSRGQQKMTRPLNVVGWGDERNNHGGQRSENVNHRSTPAREYRVIHRNGGGHYPVVQPRWRRPPLSMYRSMVIPPPDAPVGFTVPLRATSQEAEMRTVSTPRSQFEETLVVDEADDQNVSDSQLQQFSTTEQQLNDLTTMSSTTELAASNSSEAFNETAVELNSTASGSNESSDAVLTRADQALRGLQAATTSIIPAIVGFVETLTRKQFSWIDVMLAVCVTIAVFLACVNLAFFIAHVLRNKRGKLTFSNDELHRSSMTSSSRSPSDGADKKTTKQTSSSTTTTNNPSYPERQLSTSSSSSSPDASPPPPPPPLSGFSPSVVGCQKQCPREDAETLRIRPIGFKRPLTDWGFTNRLITMSAGEPHIHHLEQQQQQPVDRAAAAVCRGVIQTSMKSTTSDESSSGVESGEGTDHGSALTLPRRYVVEELDDGMVSGTQVAAAPTGSYIYGGVDGLRVNVDNGKDSGCTTHADFIYGKDYVELDTKNCSLSSGRQSTPFDESINRKQRRERAGRKAAKNRPSTMSASGHVTVLNRPWKRLFGGSTSTGNLCGKTQQHRGCGAGLDDN